MWQKNKGKFHLLINYSGPVQNGRYLETACKKVLQVEKAYQQLFPSHKSHCPVCAGVWHIVFTSVDDAKTTVKNTTNLVVLNRCLEVTSSSTLKKAILSRIRNIEKEGKNDKR